MFVQKKTDAAVARKELKRNATIFLAAVLAIRVAPYALDFLQRQTA
jgi:hypothetical protein